MQHSVRSILKHYINLYPWSRVRLTETIYGDNPEDVYYLCRVNNRQFMVFETDYFVSLSFPLKEVTEIASTKGYKPVTWLVKKESQEKIGAAIVPVRNKVDHCTDEIVTNIKGSFLKYAVIELRYARRLLNR